MSDMSQGPEWWLASDGRWYAPERHPDYVQPLPPTDFAAPAFVPTARTQTAAFSRPDFGGQILTVNRPTDTGTSWYPGSLVPAETEKMSGPDATEDSATVQEPDVIAKPDTVSSTVGALRTFVIVCVLVNTVYLLAFHLFINAFVKSALFSPYAHFVNFLDHAPATPSHFVGTFVDVTRGVALVALIFLVVLLLSRSSKVVTTMLRVWLGLSLLIVALGIVGRVYVGSEWALLTALYLGHVLSQVNQADASASRSYRAHGQKAYTPFELVLAGLIVALMVISGDITLHASSAGANGLASNLANVTSTSGRTAPPGSDPAPSAYGPLTVHAHDFTVTLNFDPNATAVVDYVPAQTIDTTVFTTDGVNIIGNELHSTTGVLITVLRLPVAVGDYACPTPAFTTTVMGQSTVVCQGQGTTGMELDVVTGGSRFQVQLASPKSPTPISPSVVQMIADSLKIG
jgi:hypothetical protein